MSMDAASRVARLQHGLIVRSQAVDAGVPARTADNWLHANRFELVHPTVYRMPGAPRTWEQRAMAAVLAASGGETGAAVASHRTAGVLWGLVEDDTVEVTVTLTRLPRSRGVIVHRTRDPFVPSIRRKIPLTNPMRTLLDLGAVVPAHVVADAIEAALVARLVTVAALENAYFEVARPGRRGAGVLRSVLESRALGSERPDSLLEARVGALLRAVGLAGFEFQFRIYDENGRFVAKVDFAFPLQRVAIEIDGFRDHGSPSAFDRDAVRQNAVVLLGWRVLRFTWRRVVRDPRGVAREIAAALSVAA